MNSVFFLSCCWLRLAYVPAKPEQLITITIYLSANTEQKWSVVNGTYKQIATFKYLESVGSKGEK